MDGARRAVLPQPDHARRPAGGGSGLRRAARREMVITSVGSPAPAVGALHDAGCLVLADVATLRHAERAIEAGADGLILLDRRRRRPDRLAQSVRLRAGRALRCSTAIVVLAGGVSDGQPWPRRACSVATWPIWAPGSSPRAESMAPTRYRSHAGRSLDGRRAADLQLHRPAGQHAGALDRRRGAGSASGWTSR